MDASAYRKVTQREHVLLRPAAYVGSLEPESCTAWLPTTGGGDGDGDEPGKQLRMERRDDVQYVPGLLKVFDEIIVNAIDHATRTRQMLAKAAASDGSNVQVVKRIEVDIDRNSGVLCVLNDGEGIPVEQHTQHGGVWVPELIFGHLLTSTNYDDDAERTVGGQNGIGAKACNILSRWFEVEVVDSTRGLRFRQRYECNMERTLPPVVEKTALKRSHAKVRFLPDYARLGMGPDARLSDDMYALMVKRVYDATAVTDPDVNVWFNSVRLDVRSFERYVDLYLGGRATNAKRAYERPADGWEVAAALSDGGGLRHVSFVNGVATLRGGRHVDHVVAQICRRLCELIAARARKGSSPPKQQFVRDNLMVFVRATVPGATFDSLAKDTLTTPVSRFGKRVDLSDAFIERLYKLEGLVERVVGLSGFAAEKEMRKTDGSKNSTVHVPKLDDAEWAGTSKSHLCTLLLTEGDSAKASARYGVFPLRGKVMNVCDMSSERIAGNAEISAIKKILGLQTGRTYVSAGELRYGRVMLMTDADTDGSHIKGLVINLFLQQWPSLLKVPGFISSLLTPIVKVVKTGGSGGGGGGGGACLEFYNTHDFERWREDNPQLAARWPAKYYKGLGTSSAEEARDWFRKMRLVAYVWSEPSSSPVAETTGGGGVGGGAGGGAGCLEALTKAFDKKRADDRKLWLQQYDPALTLSYGESDVHFSDFVERDLIHFSNYDVLRSIPSVVDGFKVSQRKAFFGCRKRNLVRGEVRVAQLAASITEHTCFHHGEASMQGTIIGMAQDFVGCGNNIPLLEPIGQFGTRLAGGSDSASPRYIHTRLARLATLLFPREDDAVLSYLSDDGTPIEPAHYLPILPMVLINGATGIGTGYSTSVPSYDPLEVLAALRHLLLVGGDDDEAAAAAGLPLLLARPWYRGFQGAIEETAAGKLRSRGLVERVTPCKARITELPLGVWTEDFKAALEKLVEAHQDVKSFENECSDATVCFTITFSNAAAASAWMAEPPDSSTGLTRLETELKLAGTKGLSTTNMHLFNAQGRIQKYATPWDILAEFHAVRLDGYTRRREHLLARLGSEVEVLRNRVLFVEAVVDGRLKLHDPERDLEGDMAALGLMKVRQDNTPKSNDADGVADDDGKDGADVDADAGRNSYKYLLSMPMASMTAKRKLTLDAQLAGKLGEVDTVARMLPRDMWAKDLDQFEAAYRAEMAGV